jgi:hypothetical protein
VGHRVNNIGRVAREEPDPNRARIIIDADKWLASKLIAKVYGDKLDVNVTSTVDLSGALSEARDRALRLRCDPVEPIDVEFETLPSVAAHGSSDDESAAPVKSSPIPDIFS